MSTLAIVRANRVRMRALRRHSRREVTTYVSAVLLVATGVAALHFLGVGAVDPTQRPGSDRSGQGVLLAVALAVITAGLVEPPFKVPRVEEQWLVVIPGGAASVVMSRVRGPLVSGTQVMVLVVVAQLLVERRSDVGLALVYGLWAAGYGLTLLALRFTFAAFVERSSRPHLRRAAAGGLVAAVLALVSLSERVLAFLGAPVTGSGQPLLSAGAWCACGAAIALVAMRNAESLVVRAIEHGRSADRFVRTSQRSLRASPEPDSFRLAGPDVLTWAWLLSRRRRWKSIVAVHATLTVLSVALLFLAPAALGEVLLGLLALIGLTSTAAGLPQPAAASILQLPHPFSALMVRRLPVSAAATCELLLVPFVAWCISGPDRDLLLAAALSALPLAVVLGVLRLRVRDPARGREQVQSRHQRIRLAGAAGGAAALYAFLPAPVGGMLAAGWLVASASLLLVIELHAAARVSGPVPGR